MSLIGSVKEYTDAASMMADYAERRKRMFAPAQKQARKKKVQAPVDTVAHCAAVTPGKPAFVVKSEPKKKSDLHRLADLEPIAEPVRPTFQNLKIVMAIRGGFSIVEFDSRQKHNDIVACRFKTWWLARKLFPMSLPEIARRSGGKDHTTVLHGIKKAEERHRDELLDLLPKFEAAFGIANGEGAAE